MNWNWFCPLPPARTGIADYAMHVLPSVAAQADVTLWIDQTEWDPAVERFGRIRNYHPEAVPWEELNRADLNIYHIGNHPEFHAGIWHVSQRCPGLIVLHDLSLHHLFGALYRDLGKRRSSYLNLMRRYHGESSIPAAVEFFDRGFSTEFMAEHFPLTWHALERVLGVVVHSHHAFEELRAPERLPVAYIPLPYPARDWTKVDPDRHRNDEIRLILFGFLGRNRRLEPLLSAIAGLERRQRLRLDICGVIHDLKNVSDLIERLGIQDIVSIRGFLSESELDSALAQAHLAINLRFPSMGEASLSQLRIWEHALPSMVTRVGWYATLPEDAVCHVRFEYEVEDIRKHLNALIDNRARFERMGEQGRALLQANHSPAAYARSLAEFSKPLRDRTNVAVDYLVERVGRVAGDWWQEDVDLADMARFSHQILAATGNE